MRWKTLHTGVCIPVLALILLSGCATHSWVPGPNARGTIDEARGYCSMAARRGGSDFYASGSPRFVAGAAVAHGIGEAIRTQNSFNDCMLSSGWDAADGPSPVSGAIGNLSACATAAYNDPAFAELKPLAPSSPNGATAEQMANSNRATDQEIRLLNERRSRILPCRQHALEQLRVASPVMAAAAAEVYAKADQNFTELVDRKITWGEYVVRNRMAADIGQARIASNTMAPPSAGPANVSSPINPAPATDVKAAQATQQATARVNDSSRASVLPSDSRPDVGPTETAPTIRAMGWESTVARLTGGR